MEVIQSELSELKKVCENTITDSKLVTCVPSLIRVEITKSEFKKVAVCLTYPSQYPANTLLLEIKSRTLAPKLLEGLSRVAEEEAKKHRGKPHALHILRFVNTFLDEHPLCCCSDEISELKSLLIGTEDKLKLSQKTSSISLTVRHKEYFLKSKIVIPNEYPAKSVEFQSTESNFPRVFHTWFVEQSKEYARRCVEPPLRPRPKDPPFEKKPSLRAAAVFLVKSVKRYPDELCQFCRKPAFPADASKAVHNENAARHVERVYCSHCYHHDCLIVYMKTPPFEGGKKCLACGKRIYHETWKVTPELAEARWAHEQAKKRELGEVIDFFADMETGDDGAGKS